jgi:hypothetical protein
MGSQMTETPTFCPVCYSQIPIDEEVCPIAASLSKNGSAGIMWTSSFRRFMADVRMRVIIAFGLQRELRAAQALIDCALRHPCEWSRGSRL